MMYKVGDFVVLKQVPPLVSGQGGETLDLIRLCVGRVLRIEDITDHGLLALACGPDIDDKVGGFMNSIYVEPEFVSALSTEDNR